VSFANDARLLASGSKDGVVLLWDLKSAPPENGRQHLPPHIHHTVSFARRADRPGSHGRWEVVRN
jgi:WD40 repeat protein